MMLIILRLVLFVTSLVLLACTIVRAEIAPVDIGSRRELFVDDALIERLVGRAELRLHHPEPREIALVHDQPWEGPGSGFNSVFKDGPVYRMYYKARYTILEIGNGAKASHPSWLCYAESDDGVHWRKPALGLIEYKGSTANNIVMGEANLGRLRIAPGLPAVFKDENPKAPADAKYKAIIATHRPNGVIPFKSADGLKWFRMSDAPVLTEGSFDSQNTAFWDADRQQYRAYWRHFSQGDNDLSSLNPIGIRALRTAVSPDLLKWSNVEDVRYPESRADALYTNAIKPYYRAPHLLVGFPARYIDRGWSESMRALPELEHREFRSAVNLRHGTTLTEGLLMTGRDGVSFKLWNDAFLRPGPERPDTWNYGHQIIAWHLVETKSALDGAPNELSLFATESYWTGNSSATRRYSLRLDGFVSVRAPLSGGELITQPVVFSGRRLALNFSTSAAGSVRVEIQDIKGKPVSGFSLADCPPIFGDAIERPVAWNGGRDLKALAGKPVRLRFVLSDADVFAYQFRD